MKKIVIAGFGSAGYAAVSTLKKLGCSDEISVIAPVPGALVHPCGIPYALEGRTDPEKISGKIALHRMGVKEISGYLRGIDTAMKKVLVETAGGITEVRYDYLLLCTGSSAFIPLIRGIGDILNKGLFPLADLKNLQSVSAALSGKKKGIVIGAGAVGLEAAAALKSHIENMMIVEGRDQVLPGVLDPDMAELVRKYLESKGIAVRLGAVVEEIAGEEEFTGLVCGGERISADIGICATGCLPNTEVVHGTGIRSGRFGIDVDSSMKTNAEGVFAAGDCAATLSVIDGKPIGAKLATSAYLQGISAARSMMGIENSYNGSAGTFVSKPASLEIAGTGFTTALARERGFDPVMSKITSKVRPDYFLDNAEVTIKIIADRKSGRIIGGQAAGDGAAARINLVSAAVELGITLERFVAVELAYCPAVSDVYDPLMRAVDGALRRNKK